MPITSNAPSGKSTKTGLILSLLLLALVVSWLLMEEPAPDAVPAKSPPLLPVTVVHLSPDSRQLSIKASGVTEPYWSTDIVPSVSGRLVNITRELEPGMLFDQGEVLVQLQDIQYQAELNDAKSQLANADMALALALHKQTVALKTAGNLKTPYARHEPQVNAAKAAKNAAESAVKNARQRLIDTRITTPFSAVILSTHATLGQWVQSSEKLLTIASRDSLNVRVELPAQLWDRLDDIRPGQPAQVITPSGHTWPATVRYLNPVRDQKTRQRTLVLKVADPYQAEAPLLPDQHVSVALPGKELINIYTTPASALTSDGNIWTVNSNNELVLEPVDIIEQNVDSTLIRFRKRPEAARTIVRFPLASMLEGQQIMPRTLTDTEMQL